MNRLAFLPVAGISLLALSACGGSADADATDAPSTTSEPPVEQVDEVVKDSQFWLENAEPAEGFYTVLDVREPVSSPESWTYEDYLVYVHAGMVAAGPSDLESVCPVYFKAEDTLDGGFYAVALSGAEDNITDSRDPQKWAMAVSTVVGEECAARADGDTVSSGSSGTDFEAVQLTAESQRLCKHAADFRGDYGEMLGKAVTGGGFLTSTVMGLQIAIDIGDGAAIVTDTTDPVLAAWLNLGELQDYAAGRSIPASVADDALQALDEIDALCDQ